METKPNFMKTEEQRRFVPGKLYYLHLAKIDFHRANILEGGLTWYVYSPDINNVNDELAKSNKYGWEIHERDLVDINNYSLPITYLRPLKPFNRLDYEADNLMDAYESSKWEIFLYGEKIMILGYFHQICVKDNP